MSNPIAAGLIVAGSVLGAGGFAAGLHAGMGSPADPPAVQVARLVRDVCGDDEETVAFWTAISLAESGGRPDAVGDTTITDSQWGPSYGLFQVRSLWSQQGTGQTRDADALADPAFNARSMREISGGCENARPWSVYLNGSYQARMGEAREAARTALAGPSPPPPVALGPEFDGLQPDFARRLAAMIGAAPGSITIYSGYRDPATQYQLWQAALSKYGSTEAARQWVAPSDGTTCSSEHCQGTAADLSFGDGMEEWAHENGPRFGVCFPLDHENWHSTPCADAAPLVPSTPVKDSAAAKPPPKLGQVADVAWAKGLGLGSKACASLRANPETPMLASFCDMAGKIGAEFTPE